MAATRIATTVVESAIHSAMIAITKSIDVIVNSPIAKRPSTTVRTMETNA